MDFGEGLRPRPQPSSSRLDEIAGPSGQTEETLVRHNRRPRLVRGHVSHEELAEAIDRAAGRILTEGVDRRFEVADPFDRISPGAHRSNGSAARKGPRSS